MSKFIVLTEWKQSKNKKCLIDPSRIESIIDIDGDNRRVITMYSGDYVDVCESIEDIEKVLERGDNHARQ